MTYLAACLWTLEFVFLFTIEGNALLIAVAFSTGLAASSVVCHDCWELHARVFVYEVQRDRLQRTPNDGNYFWSHLKSWHNHSVCCLAFDFVCRSIFSCLLTHTHTHTHAHKKKRHWIDHEALCILGDLTLLLVICQTYTTVGNNTAYHLWGPGDRLLWTSPITPNGLYVRSGNSERESLVLWLFV